MKLLVITEYIKKSCYNGAQVFSRDLFCELRKKHDIDVLARESEDDLAPLKYGISEELYAEPEALSHYLRTEVDLSDYDLVYNLGGLAFGCLIVGHLEPYWRQVPLVNHFQILFTPFVRMEKLGKAFEESFGGPQKKAAAMASLNVFASQNELQAAYEHGVLSKSSRAAVIPNGLAASDFEINTESPVRLPKAEQDNRVVIITAGRFGDYVKGADLIYRAFVRLAKEREDVFLVSIGDNERFGYILQSIPEDRYQLIDWLGRKAVLSAMKQADFAVVPSRYEPFGLIAIEAMAQGLPVIANDVGGLSEIVNHGRNGLLNPLNNGSLGLYLLMKRLVENELLRKKMSGEALRSVKEQYNIERVGDLVDQQLSRASLSYKALEFGSV